MVRSLATITVTVAAGTLIFALVPMHGDYGYLGAAAAVAAQLSLIPLTVRRARQIATAEHPIATAAEAIVFLLLVLVYGFASGYVLLADQPGQIDGIETKIDSVYFTVTTLATVGFGDVHAQGQLARVVVTGQMLLDLVFIAVVVRFMTGIARRRITEEQTS